MTTSIEATLHGHIAAAAGANPAGPLAVLAAFVLLVRRPSRPMRVPLALVVAVLAGMWLLELHRYSLL
jgi:hypothetical protein